MVFALSNLLIVIFKISELEEKFLESIIFFSVLVVRTPPFSLIKTNGCVRRKRRRASKKNLRICTIIVTLFEQSFCVQLKLSNYLFNEVNFILRSKPVILANED